MLHLYVRFEDGLMLSFASILPLEFDVGSALGAVAANNHLADTELPGGGVAEDGFTSGRFATGALHTDLALSGQPSRSFVLCRTTHRHGWCNVCGNCCLCDVISINNNINSRWYKPFGFVYQYIICIFIVHSVEFTGASGKCRCDGYCSTCNIIPIIYIISDGQNQFNSIGRHVLYRHWGGHSIFFVCTKDSVDFFLIDNVDQAERDGRHCRMYNINIYFVLNILCRYHRAKVGCGQLTNRFYYFDCVFM